ncbi:MAG TPA: FAD-dependent oxidoreductase, partial [Spirochaetia bacterium]|nr:FAD-dependent oxidoreductase [Spirochaetia bacterium]
MKYVIIGGVAGGATTAARLRRNDENAEIIMLERGEFISYANCGLPYYLGGVITERDRLFVQSPESFNRTFRVDVRTASEVVSINRDDKTVSVRESGGKEYLESYDKLVLSPGAEPIRPPIPGINGPGIFTLRSVPDVDKIAALMESNKPKRAVIVGAGFIGLEMAENLHRRGIFVTIVEMANQVMNILDYEMAAAVHQHLKVKNVEFYLQDGVASFTQDGNHTIVALKSGRRLVADLVILSIGVRPDTALAKDAGLAIGKSGGIVVDKYLQTSDPDVYAVGDAIEFISPITGNPTVIPLAGPANKQARIAADNICNGNTRSYRGAIGTGIAKVFDLTVASTGASEKLLQRENIPYLSVVTHSSSHAGYYPNAIPMSIKTIFSPTGGRLLGAQVVGYEGVDKRIDLFASVLRNSGTIYDLQEIEHAYAPPFSSAKDPVNIAGFVAENVLVGQSHHIHWNQLLQTSTEERFLVDVRTPEEFAIDTIEGAVNIPVDTIRDRLDE